MKKLSAIHGGNDRMAELEAAVKESDTAYEQAAHAVSEAVKQPPVALMKWSIRNCRRSNLMAANFLP